MPVRCASQVCQSGAPDWFVVFVQSRFFVFSRCSSFIFIPPPCLGGSDPKQLYLQRTQNLSCGCLLSSCPASRAHRRIRPVTGIQPLWCCRGHASFSEIGLVASPIQWVIALWQCCTLSFSTVFNVLSERRGVGRREISEMISSLMLRMSAFLTTAVVKNNERLRHSCVLSIQILPIGRKTGHLC